MVRVRPAFLADMASGRAPAAATESTRPPVIFTASALPPAGVVASLPAFGTVMVGDGPPSMCCGARTVKEVDGGLSPTMTRKRGRNALIVLPMFLTVCIAAQAQAPVSTPPATLTNPAPASAPPDKRAATDRLLDALKAAPTEQAAAALENQLQQMWLHAGTPTVTLLMSRGLRSLQAGQDDEAVGSFSDAIILQPDVAEAWHQRALARYHAGDVNGAIRDLEQTVQLEPRNFAAFRTLADIAAAQEDWKGAYASWQQVMELDPKTPNGEDRLRLLKRKAVGEDT